MTSKPRTTTDAVDAPVLEQINPRTLLVDHNIRTDSAADKDLVESVRMHGVLVPLVGVRTDDGVRVRYGHRRTHAATEANLPTVPVWVFAATDAGDDVDRIVRQWAENEHRAGLTQTDRAQAVEQLAAFGVSAAQITKRLRTKRAEVDTVLTIAASPFAKAAAARYGFLTLDQAAALTEFDTTDEHDKETVKALVAAAQSTPLRFAHVAQRARDERAERANIAAMREQVEATGVAVHDGEDPTRYGYKGVVRALRDLTDTDGAHLTIAGHTTCPGHAVHLAKQYGDWTADERATVSLDVDSEPGATDLSDLSGLADVDDLDDGYHDEPAYDDEDDDEPTDQVGDEDPAHQRTWSPRWVGTYVCTDPATHGHIDTRPAPTTGSGAKAREDMTDVEREEARAARRAVIENNKAWASAETVRIGWLRTWLTRKTAPKTAAAFIATALAHDGALLADVGGNTLAADLLGASSTGYGRSDGLVTLITQASDARAQVLALAQVLAAYEARTSREDWRNLRSQNVRYLTYLADNGYGLADVERLACGQAPLPQDTDTAQDTKAVA